MIKIVSNKGVTEIITLFAITLFLGFGIAIAALATSRVSVIDSSLASPQFAYFAYMLDVFIIGTLLLIILRRHHSKTALFRTLEFIVVGFTSFFLFLVVYSIILPLHASYLVALPDHIEFSIPISSRLGLVVDYLLAAITAIALIVTKEFKPRLKDVATMTSSMGVGILLGISFSFFYAMIILAVVAFYDYITIFLSKAIVQFDKALIALDISFLISVSDIEAVPHGNFSKKEEEEYEEYLIRSHKTEDPKFKKIIKQGKLPMLSQISLGEGDLSLPLMAAISAYYTYINYEFAGIVMIGAIVGVTLTMLLLKRYKKPLPAIPPFFGCISIATGAAYLVTGLYRSASTSYASIFFIAIGLVIMILTIYTLPRDQLKEKMREDLELEKGRKKKNREKK